MNKYEVDQLLFRILVDTGIKVEQGLPTMGDIKISAKDIPGFIQTLAILNGVSYSVKKEKEL